MAGTSVVAQTLAGAGPASQVAAELRELEHALADPERAGEMEKLLEALRRGAVALRRAGGLRPRRAALGILSGLGFSQERMDGDVGALSGGWKMRVALARILLMKPDALLLDEPSNHLDLESLIWLENFLKAFEGAILLTSHDREFMNRVVSKIIEIDAGELTAYSGDYEFYLRQRAIADRHAEAQYARQQAMLKKEIAFIERFKARASHAAQVQSRIKKIDKIEKVEPPKVRKTVEFDFPRPQRSGEDVARLAKVRKAYGSQVVYDGFRFPGAARRALVRPRRQWRGQEHAPQAGGRRRRAGRRRGRDRREREGGLLRPARDGRARRQKTVQGTLVDRFPQSSLGALRTLAGCFGFSGDEVEKSVRVLSGGEKARLVLAMMLFDPPNFLVLDEPTNHLDIATKEMLIGALRNFDGTMLFVSHDRHFLAELSNRVLELTPEGPHVYGGGYTEYVARTGHEAPGLRS